MWDKMAILKTISGFEMYFFVSNYDHPSWSWDLRTQYDMIAQHDSTVTYVCFKNEHITCQQVKKKNCSKC